MDGNNVFGFVKTELDGTEHIFSAEPSLELPKSYSYINDIPPVWDQGSAPICVTCSSSAFLNWKKSVETGNPRDINVKLMEIYKSKTNSGDGMTYKDAFKFLKHTGVHTNEGLMKINGYALVKNLLDLKAAIVANGPCPIALPVYGNNNGIPDEFWKKSNGVSMGGHAVCVVGYTEEGLIIRNSWGKNYGTNGHILLKYPDQGQIIEMWTIIA